MEKRSLSKDLALKKDPLSLKQAKDILQAVVSIHESSINPSSSLNQLVGYDVQQIREAALTACLDVIGQYEGAGRTQTKKKGNNGLATLILRYGEGGMPETVGFYASINSRPILGADFPLVDPKDEVGRRFVNFLNFDKGELTMLDRPLDLHGYQQLFKGARLMFANMLNWNKPNIISPEQLDHPSLSMSPIKKILARGFFALKKS